MHNLAVVWQHLAVVWQHLAVVWQHLAVVWQQAASLVFVDLLGFFVFLFF